MTSARSISEPPQVQPAPKSAYFHVPFCAHRCGYCDFTLIAGRDDLFGDFLTALEREINQTKVPPQTQLDTLFFGGGTPTHLPPRELQRLFDIVDATFKSAPDAEISVEANPLDLTDTKIDILLERGVNRVSLGVQSFSPAALALLERSHSPAEIEDVATRLKSKLANISFDLIFGVPGQSLEDWRATLQRAIDLNPTHISTYGLTFEHGTAFWTRRERGQLASVDEELERDQYALAMEMMETAGFAQYEISSFAKPGFECRHNHIYWAGKEYWAFGPGAARYIGGQRETNIRSVLGWLARIERGEPPVADTEHLDELHRARELIYLGLRRNTGINREEFHQQTGHDLDTICGEALQQQINLGTITDDGQRVHLTREGRFIADRVVMEFL